MQKFNIIQKVKINGKKDKILISVAISVCFIIVSFSIYKINYLKKVKEIQNNVVISINNKNFIEAKSNLKKLEILNEMDKVSIYSKKINNQQDEFVNLQIKNIWEENFKINPDFEFISNETGLIKDLMSLDTLNTLNKSIEISKNIHNDISLNNFNNATQELEKSKPLLNEPVYSTFIKLIEDKRSELISSLKNKIIKDEFKDVNIILGQIKKYTNTNNFNKISTEIKESETDYKTTNKTKEKSVINENYLKVKNQDTYNEHIIDTTDEDNKMDTSTNQDKYLNDEEIRNSGNCDPNLDINGKFPPCDSSDEEVKSDV